MVDVNISNIGSSNIATINSYSSNLLNPLRANTVASNRSPGTPFILSINTYSSNLLNSLRSNTLTTVFTSIINTTPTNIINSYSSNILNSIRGNDLLISATSGSQSSLITEGQLFPRGNSLYSLERFSTYSLNIGLRSYFKLNNTVVDNIVGRSFTLVNNPIYTTGKINNGITFNNTNQLCYITSAAFPVSEKDFSIALWVNIPSIPSGGSGYFTVFSRDDFGLDYDTTNNRFRLYILNSAGTTFTIINPIYSITPNSWQLFIISYDSFYKKVRFRFNNSTPQLFDYTFGFSNTGTTFYLNGQSSIYTWLGLVIDELGFWDNRILSSSEEELLWNNGNGRTYLY